MGRGDTNNVSCWLSIQSTLPVFPVSSSISQTQTAAETAAETAAQHWCVRERRFQKRGAIGQRSTVGKWGTVGTVGQRGTVGQGRAVGQGSGVGDSRGGIGDSGSSCDGWGGVRDSWGVGNCRGGVGDSGRCDCWGGVGEGGRCNCWGGVRGQTTREEAGLGLGGGKGQERRQDDLKQEEMCQEYTQKVMQ